MLSHRDRYFVVLSSSSTANASAICPGGVENRCFDRNFQCFLAVFAILRMIQPASSARGSGRSLDCLLGKLRHTGQSISLAPVRRGRHFRIHHPVRSSLRENPCTTIAHNVASSGAFIAQANRFPWCEFAEFDISGFTIRSKVSVYDTGGTKLIFESAYLRSFEKIQ